MAHDLHSGDDAFEHLGDGPGRKQIQRAGESIDHRHHVIGMGQQCAAVRDACEHNLPRHEPGRVEAERGWLLRQGARDQTPAAMTHDVDVERRARRHVREQPLHVLPRIVGQREMVERKHTALVAIEQLPEGGVGRSD